HTDLHGTSLFQIHPCRSQEQVTVPFFFEGCLPFCPCIVPILHRDIKAHIFLPKIVCFLIGRDSVKTTPYRLYFYFLSLPHLKSSVRNQNIILDQGYLRIIFPYSFLS